MFVAGKTKAKAMVSDGGTNETSRKLIGTSKKAGCVQARDWLETDDAEVQLQD